jgi:hypothetical protein
MFLHTDMRLPGHYRHFLSKRQFENLMFVPDEIQKIVVFIGHKKKDLHDPKIAGTAFGVALRNEGIEVNSTYLVTAKHCIDDIKASGDDGKVHLRVNFLGSNARFVETDISDWVFHPTESEKVDVAVFPLQDADRMDIHFLPGHEHVLASRLLKNKGIGPGDEVLITGLFSFHAGKERNIPIVRIGNIAGIPQEPVEVEWCKPHLMEAFLIEARSIGGLSGSPVFVRSDLERTEKLLPEPSQRMEDFNRQAQRQFYWLGLIHGHWNYRVPDTDFTVAGDQEDAERKKINAGIAIVVPADKILETLAHPDLAEKRRAFIGRIVKSRDDLAVPD